MKSFISSSRRSASSNELERCFWKRPPAPPEPAPAANRSASAGAAPNCARMRFLRCCSLDMLTGARAPVPTPAPAPAPGPANAPVGQLPVCARAAAAEALEAAGEARAALALPCASVLDARPETARELLELVGRVARHETELPVHILFA